MEDAGCQEFWVQGSCPGDRRGAGEFRVLGPDIPGAWGGRSESMQQEQRRADPLGVGVGMTRCNSPEGSSKRLREQLAAAPRFYYLSSAGVWGWVTVPPSPVLSLIFFFFLNQCLMMGCPPGGAGKGLGDPPAAPPDPLEVRPLPECPCPQPRGMQPQALIAEGELGEGPGRSMHSRGRCPQCDWHNLDLFTRVDGRGCPMARGDLRRLLFGWGESWRAWALAPPPPSWGPGGGEGPGGVCWRGRLVSVAYY